MTDSVNEFALRETRRFFEVDAVDISITYSAGKVCSHRGITVASTVDRKVVHCEFDRDE